MKQVKLLSLITKLQLTDPILHEPSYDSTKPHPESCKEHLNVFIFYSFFYFVTYLTDQ